MLAAPKGFLIYLIKDLFTVRSPWLQKSHSIPSSCCQRTCTAWLAFITALFCHPTVGLIGTRHRAQIAPSIERTRCQILCVGGALASNTRARSRVKPTQRHPFSWKQHKSKQLQVFASFCIHSMPWETPKKQYMACLCHCRLGFGFTRDSYATTNAASKPGFKQLAICRWLIAMPGCNDAPSCFKPFHCLFSWYTSVGSIVTLS